MADYDYDIGIIGGGAAGLTVAAGAARLGAKTLLIEKEKELGGDCLHYGCVPSKTLIRSARAYHEMQQAEEFGLPPVQHMAPVDFSAIAKRIDGVIQTLQKHDSDERFCRLGAAVLHGEPEFADDHAVTLNGRSYSAKNWVIATGSSPAVPLLKGIENTRFLTNKKLFSLEKLPQSLIILGGGPIAVEMAQAFSRLGSRVSVVQRSNQILSREDTDMADGLMEALEGEGVKFYLDCSVQSVNAGDGFAEVVLRFKNEEKMARLSGERLLVAMGRKPNLEGLCLSSAGVESDGKGLTLDRRLRTTRKHIFGAGDVTGTHLFTHAAGYEGGIVVSNAIFHLPRKVDYTLMPWCTYTGPELAGIGMNEKAAAAVGIRYSVQTEAFAENDRSLAEGDGAGKLKMILDEKEKVIGVQILGRHAGELLNEWVAVLNGNVKLSALASSVHPYPTLGEINKRVAGSYFSPKIFSERMKKGLKIFFHLKGRACE